MKPTLTTPTPPLKMLYDLLEEYAPAWYTEEHHNKAEAALRFVRNDLSEN
jgi:hypothetical protein